MYCGFDKDEYVSGVSSLVVFLGVVVFFFLVSTCLFSPHEKFDQEKAL